MGGWGHYCLGLTRSPSPLAAAYTDSMDIASLRKSYERDELDEASAAADPLNQFQLWLPPRPRKRLSEPRCYIPCDHAPVRSWPLFRAREIMPALIASFKQGDKS